MVVDAVGALLSASLQVLIDRLASPQLLDLFRSNTYEAVEDMKLLLLSVNAVLGDAEEKQLLNPHVKIWVEELQEAVYDAQDLLDLVDTQALQYEVESESHNTMKRVAEYFDSINPFTKAINFKLGKINSRLQVLRDHKNHLGLIEYPKRKHSPLNIPTTRMVDQSKVCGRDHDKEKISQRMFDAIAMGEGEEPVSVVAIVGMAGVGKTTLSQLLFNDARVVTSFDEALWVYVSELSDVFHLTSKVYESVTDLSSGNKSLDTLQVHLNGKLRGQKLLLVLDDVWAESFLEWDLFKMAFANVSPGSVILVTTRNEDVAITMHAATTYFLPHLSDEDCWDIFSHYAFGHRDRDPDATLKKIGEKIVKKCKGLPLAAKVFGSLLHSAESVEEWSYILHSKIWDLPTDKSNLLSALRLSYQFLPSHLKACFAYCSLFPKGYEINKWNLIHLWMAEDLLRPPKTKTVYKLGEEYLHELLSRSLLQRSIKNDSCVIMHDLTSDLAQYAGGEFFHFCEDGNVENIPTKVRHLSFFQDKFDAPEKFEAFYDLSHLRTFLPFRLSDISQFDSLTDAVFNTLVLRLICIRVLSLSSYPITTLPSTIGNLKHLRYLNLSRTKIQNLPESIGLLYNLQVLLLANCIQLTSLPKNMRNLTDLRHLNIIGAPLTEMPPHFGRLKLLRCLTTFIVSRNTGSRISELGALFQLHGSLSIVNLQSVIDATDASKANLMGKTSLDELVFKWTTASHNINNEAIVLYNLHPHKNLKRLKIENYGGTTFPGWLGNPSFSIMVSIHLTGCINCLSLPPLGQLSSLKTLLIANMASLERVGHEFYGNANSPFRALEILTFEDMHVWKDWLPTEVEEFPSLKELHIRTCPELTGKLPSHLGSLNKLVISECHNLANSFPRVPMLRELELTDCDALVSLPEEMMQGNTHIRKVTLSNCSSLKSFPALGLPTRLESLHIRNCRNLQLLRRSHHHQAIEHLHLEGSCDTLRSFPLSSFRALRDLHIQDCPNLQSLRISQGFTDELPHLENIQLKNCPNLVSFPFGGLPAPNLGALTIYNCENLSPKVEWGLHAMELLDSFRIEGGLIGLESFPEEGLLPACLTELHITGLANLTSLNQTGLQYLVSLKRLVIGRCNMLQSLPAQGLPDSLSTLIIMDCPLLVPLCQCRTGVYWPLISNIPNIVIDGERMQG